MQRLCWSRMGTALAVLILLASTDRLSHADTPPAKTYTLKPLPKNIVTAWKVAGAEAGWMQPTPFGLFRFVHARDGKPGDLPAFRFGRWQAGHLTQLPIPETAFGLIIGNYQYTELSEAGIKEMASLKNLQALELYNIGITDAGVKELVGMKQLQSLGVDYTSLKGKSKDLAGLTNLRRLKLNTEEMTDADLKELARLINLQA